MSFLPATILKYVNNVILFKSYITLLREQVPKLVRLIFINTYEIKSYQIEPFWLAMCLTNGKYLINILNFLRL
jgi:hypothetical protein